MEDGSVVASIIIPVYNTEDYLSACLDSVLAQTERNIEVILVDDGSTDGSLEIERSYERRDPRVRVIEQPNLRQGAARNRGIEQARGTYVYLMDSDDLIVPELVETCVALCEADDLDFVTFDTAGFRDDPTIERPELFHEVGDRSGRVDGAVYDGVTFWSRYCAKGCLPYICWLEFFRRDFVLREGLTFEEGIYFEDNDWIVRIYLAARRMRYVPLKLHRYRDRPGSNVHSGFKEVLAESCPKIHDILLDLFMRQETPERRSMVSDVGGGVCRRFIQIRELDPSEGFKERMLVFAEALRAEISNPQVPLEARQWHLRAYLSLARGVSGWKTGRLSLGRDLAAEVLLGGRVELPRGGTLAIYGTGNACRLLLRTLDIDGLPVVFLESGEPREPEFMGRPVLCIHDARDRGISTVIVASTAFAAQMEATCREVLGDDVAVMRVSRAVLSLTDDGISPGVVLV